jgi:hypothetical protein
VNCVSRRPEIRERAAWASARADSLRNLLRMGAREVLRRVVMSERTEGVGGDQVL